MSGVRSVQGTALTVLLATREEIAEMVRQEEDGAFSIELAGVCCITGAPPGLPDSSGEDTRPFPEAVADVQDAMRSVAFVAWARSLVPAVGAAPPPVLAEPPVIAWCEVELLPSDHPGVKVMSVPSLRLAQSAHSQLLPYACLAALCMAWDFCCHHGLVRTGLLMRLPSRSVGVAFLENLQRVTSRLEGSLDVVKIDPPSLAALSGLETSAYVQYLEVATHLACVQSQDVLTLSMKCISALHKIVESTSFMVLQALDIPNQDSVAGVAKQIAAGAVAASQAACVALWQQEQKNHDADDGKGPAMADHEAMQLMDNFATVLKVVVHQVTAYTRMVSSRPCQRNATPQLTQLTPFGRHHCFPWACPCLPCTTLWLKRCKL